MQNSSLHSRRQFQSLSIGLLLSTMARSGCCHWSARQEDGNQLKAAINQFALNLLKTIHVQKPAENHFVSPFSIESALLMTLEGAVGKTAEQMVKTLELPLNGSAVVEGEAWDSVYLRSEMQSLLLNFQPSDLAVETEQREQLKKMRAEHVAASTRVKKLVNSGDVGAADKLSAQLIQLSEQINALAKTVDQYELRIANGIWADQNSPFEPDFIAKVQQYFFAEIRNVDFRKNAEQQRLAINTWVSRLTENRISDLLPPRAVDAMTRMVLANAIYFRGNWSEPFDQAQTKYADFYAQGVQAQQALTMHKYCTRARYAAFTADGKLFPTPLATPRGLAPQRGYPEEGFQVVELMYNGGKLSLLILLPRQRTGLKALMDRLTAQLLDDCVAALQARDVFVAVPKFKLEAAYDLQNALRSMGMTDAFDPNNAQFPKMSAESLFISKVLYKAFVEVNEKGTEAAAATAVIMTRSSAQPQPMQAFVPQFLAHHPFIFAIRHNRSGVCLFLGKLESPCEC
jgi:serpin B